MVDLEYDSIDYGTIADDAADLGGYGQFSIRVGERVFFNFGGILSENFSFQLGLSVTI